MMPTDWEARWLDRAAALAAWSKDPSTKVGCVLVRERHAISEGYNGFPRGANDDPALYLERALKYERTVHAEANAVALAAKFGHRTEGATAFVTFPVCPPCATLLIQAGIVQVVVQMPRCLYCEERARDLVTGWTRTMSVSPADHTHRIQGAGGSEVVRCGMPRSLDWLARFEVSKQLLQEAGVPVTLR